MANPQTPGMRIRKLREDMGLSPDELSDRTGPEGPSADTIARIEAGIIRPFGPFLQYIADALSVTTLFIMSGRSEPKDEIISFAEREFTGVNQQKDFVAYAKEASFRNRNLTYDELRVLKREYLRRRAR